MCGGLTPVLSKAQQAESQIAHLVQGRLHDQAPRIGRRPCRVCSPGQTIGRWAVERKTSDEKFITRIVVVLNRVCWNT
jgi:hypothetical protein